MRRLPDRATVLAFILFGLTVVLGLIDLALGERSSIDVAVVALFGAVSLGIFALLWRTAHSLRRSVQAQEELARRLGQQHAVARLGQLALTDVPEQELLDQAAELVAAELGADRATVVETNRERGTFVIRACVGPGDGEPGTEIPGGPHSQAGYTASAGGPVIMNDAAGETRFSLSPQMRADGMTSGISTTIGSSGSAYGVLAAHTRRRRNFSDSDVTFLEAIANVLASAIRRRRAETNAEKTHRVLEAVIESTTDSIFVKDMEGRFVALNETAAATFGCPAADLIGRTLFDVLSPADAERLTRTDELIIATGAVETYEENIPGPDGTRVVEGTKGPYRARDGTLLGTFGIARNITQRKAQEQELARSEETFRLAQQGARMGTWDVDLASGKTTWSTGLRALYGVGSDYPTSLEDLGPLVHPDDRARVLATAGDAYNRGEGFEFEFRLIRPDGTPRSVLSRASVYHGPDGSLARILGVAVDITERKLAQDELERSEQMLQLAQTSAGLGAWDWNLETDELTWTPAMYTILGLDPASSEPSYEGFSSRVHPEDLAVFEAAVQRCLTSGDTNYESVCRVVRPSGEVRWTINRGTIIRDDDEKPTRVIGITLDETDRRQVEARLRQAEKLEAIGQLAGGVAHDFNNLLVAINGYTELALRQLDRGDSDVTGHLGAVLAAADRAAGLTRQLLAFGRRQVLTPEIIDLGGVVRDTVGLLERVLGDNVELVTKLAGEPVVVEADRGQLEQVIMNLAVNARDAMPDGGRLTITVEPVLEPGGDVAQLSVSDEGSGIDAEIAAHIFEPFFTTKGNAGTGLGLSTVHGIVTQSGGHLFLDTKLGRGSTFKIRLPLSHSQPLPAATGHGEAIHGGTETILVVEDDASVRSIVTVMLEELGYVIVGAASGEEAVELFETPELDISLVLSDVMLRGIDGRTTIERIRAIEPATKALYMSGYTDDVAIETNKPGTAFIQKPFSGDELCSRVRELLDSKT